MIYAVRVYEVSESSAFKLCECCEVVNLSWQFVPGTLSRKLKRGLTPHLVLTCGRSNNVGSLKARQCLCDRFTKYPVNCLGQLMLLITF